ncbi:MAG: glycoside hydrolase family 3 C-terminal domain-containing protein [Saprospiraceae bacterium]|nr:glycoside hydrolase family 3 C-terminal domain-containing protein [Saprospiraceae bacterium]
MKKYLRITLKALGVILLILLILGLGGWWYLQRTFMNFEKGYPEKHDLKEITIDGYRFLDRNGNGTLDIYEDARKPVSDRVEDLLSQMTIEEKIHLPKGSGLASGTGSGKSGEGIPGAAGTIAPTPRLGIPSVYLSDGPAGLRIQPTRKDDPATYYCTAFPIGTVLASTWNTGLVEQVGEAMGNEALEYGLDVILGPGVNIQRNPLCGRNFEYYSEDPLLTGYIGAAMVNGIESNGVGSSVKHFVANNQETNRNNNDSRVSERALREIYLKGFEIIVKQAQPWTIMSSYNKLNGTYTSEDRALLTELLRGEWGFKGLVMSDWFGGQNAVAQVNAGNDLLEPGTRRQWKALNKGYKEGTLSEKVIDESVRRILALIIGSKKMENYAYSNHPDLEAHARVTRQSAAEGMILLKNASALPLDKSMNVALIGGSSFDFVAGGTGSGDVNEAYSISLEQGLQNAGFLIDQASKNTYQAYRDAHEDAFEKREGLSAMFNPYTPPQIPYTGEELAAIERDADVAVITIGRNSGEGGDRVEANDFLLREEEQDMIEKTCAVFHQTGKQVVVVLNIGGVIETSSWSEKPDAILLAWQGGQEGGNSVADILSGAVNPSGKLPMTFPINLNDHASNANFPQDGKSFSLMDLLSSKDKPEAKKVKNVDYTQYEEGIYVGYRHFDKANLNVAYPFGYGLSYTNFAYGDLQVQVTNDTVTLNVTVSNTGQVAGKEIAEVYVVKPDTRIDRPLRELKGFAKTNLLLPGETQILTIRLAVPDLAYWDEQTNGWVVEPGTYQIQVGASSRDIRLSGDITL